jgi:small Trp-rich protein
MTDKKVSVNANPGWFGLLGVIFVVAKVFEIGPVAAWSWWLVLLPFYFGIALVLGILAFGAVSAGAVLGVAHLMDMYQRRQRRIAREKAEVWRQLGGK